MALILTASYALDWAVLIVFGVLGYVVGKLSPNKRPFYVDDLDIDFPYKNYDTISVPVLFVVSIIVPAAIIFFLAMAFVPGPTAGKVTPKSVLWKHKLWEWHAGWLGLALSLVTAWFFTSGIKNLMGKPRPNLLSRCQPDLANIAKYHVGATANTARDSRLVSAEICQNPAKTVVDEGFRSFPSGHSSAAASGLVYLSLVLAVKLNTGVPLLPHSLSQGHGQYFNAFTSRSRAPSSSQPVVDERCSNVASFAHRRDYREISEDNRLVSPARDQASAPPVYLYVITFVPFAAAVFIACSRWYDFQHHGFDIISGFFIGTFTALLAFRYYYLPLGQGAGWARGPRSANWAFWAGVGNTDSRRDDVEAQHVNRGGDNTANADSRDSYQLHVI